MGRRGRGGSLSQKPAAVATASTLGLLALAGGGLGGPSGVEKKLLVMRGMMMVSQGATPTVERESCCVERESCRRGERERELQLWRERETVDCFPP